MRFAIYSRKSKFTGKGESIENQVDDCRRYIMTAFPDTKDSDIFIYEDEGYSGKNTNRPQFQQMMREEEKSPFDFIVVYRLDRISRNMSDFAQLLDKLSKKGTSFYSTNEKFDTSTISGQMMMTISAAFAQFERQIIAERVKDNVYKLAKTGRWLGGTPPLGFYSEKIEYVDEYGTDRKCFKLTENKDEISLVKLIYSKYLESRSINKVQTFLAEHGYKTRKGADFYVSTIRYILINPTYCTADEEGWRYFKNSGCDIADDRSKCNGKFGFIGYKKTVTQPDDKREGTEISDWTIAVGKHKGVIPSSEWIEVQQIIEGNTERKVGFRQAHNAIALLSGVLRCKCGGYMRPKYHKANKSGVRSFSYICEKKEISRQLCDGTNVDGRVVDRMVCDALLDYQSDESVFAQYVREVSELGSKAEQISHLIKNQEAEIGKKKKAVSNLIRRLSDSSDIATSYINDEINSLDSEIKACENEVKRLERLKQGGETLSTAIRTTEETLKSFRENFDTLSVDSKRRFIRKCVSRAEWDGENVSVFLLDR